MVEPADVEVVKNLEREIPHRNVDSSPIPRNVIQSSAIHPHSVGTLLRVDYSS